MRLNSVPEKAKWLLRRALIVAMVLCLASTAQHSLSFLATAPALIPGSYSIHVRQREPESPRADRPELRLDDLVVDGRRLRFESTERSPHWSATKRVSLLYHGGSEQGTLSFAGAGFVLVAKARAWSGTFEVQRANGDTQVVEVDAPAGRAGDVLVEEPPAPLSGLVFIAALLLFTLAACIFAAWRSDRRVSAWLVFFLMTFHALLWATQCVATTYDSRPYLDCLAHNLKGFPAYFPPGYPAFLGLIELFSDENLGRWIALVQHGLAVFAAFWSYSLARRLVPVELALLSGILAGTLSPISAMSQTVMSEIPTVFAMVGALWFGLRAAETGRYRFAMLAGTLTGWGGLLRAVPLVALLPAIGLLLWFSSAQRKVRLVAVTVGFAAGIVLLPVAWFTYKSRMPALATSAGQHLYNRVVYEQKQLDETGPATQTLLKILDGEDPRRFDWCQVLDRPGFRQLPPEDKTYNKTEELLRLVAREGILKDPLAYFSYTPGLAWRELVGGAGHISSWASTSTLDAGLESPPPLRLSASGLRWRLCFDRVHHNVWPLLCWGAIMGVLLGVPLPERGLVLALACVPAGYLLGNASLEFFLARYGMPTIPFIVILSMVPLQVILTGWVASVNTPSPETAADTLSSRG